MAVLIFLGLFSGEAKVQIKWTRISSLYICCRKKAFDHSKQKLVTRFAFACVLVEVDSLSRDLNRTIRKVSIIVCQFLKSEYMYSRLSRSRQLGGHVPAFQAGGPIKG